MNYSDTDELNYQVGVSYGNIIIKFCSEFTPDDPVIPEQTFSEKD